MKIQIGKNYIYSEQELIILPKQPKIAYQFYRKFKIFITVINHCFYKIIVEIKKYFEIKFLSKNKSKKFHLS